MYGKTCENVRNRRDIKLCTSEKKARRLFDKPKFKSRTIFKNGELIAVEMAKTVIKSDKPGYRGTCILDLSKLLMYLFHYDVIKRSKEIRSVYCSRTLTVYVTTRILMMFMLTLEQRKN
jgi:hypothetical protein